MADKTNISTYTAYDIEKYHKGLLSAAEMNKLERAALEDPFLADALDGYAENPVDLAADLADLGKRLQQKKDEKKVVPITGKGGGGAIWWRVAAMFIVIAGIGYGGYRFAFNEDNKEMALENTDTQKQSAPVQAPAAVNDSNTQALGNLSTETEQSTLVDDQREPTTKAPTDHKNKDLAAPVQAAPAEVATLSIKQDTVALNEVAISSYKTEAKKSFEVSDAAIPEFKKESAAVARQRSAAVKQEADEALAMRNNNQFAQRQKAHGPDAGNRANIYRGQVVDAQQNPIPFANISNQVDNVGTYSDAQGRFALLSPDSVLKVQVRSLGFKDKNIALQNNAASNQVILQDDQSISAIVLNQKRLNSNTPSRQNNLVFDEPQPEAGWYNYDSYLANNIRIPEDEFLKSKKQAPNNVGEVQLSFEVSKQGRPINIKVEKSLCPACDKEAIRLLKEGPKWKRNKGKKQNTTITVSF